MVHGSIAFLGSAVGCVIALVGGGLAASAAWRAAKTEGERELLRQLFTLGGLYAALDMTLILLASSRTLPATFLYLAFALWFVPLGPVMAHINRRLAALRVETD